MALSYDEIAHESRIYIVSEFVDKSQNSTGYYWHKIIVGLSNKRADVNVISTPLSCGLVDKSDHPATYISASGSGTYKKNGLISRALGQMALSFHFIKTIVRHVKKGDVIFSGTNPAFLLLFISILRPLVGFKWTLLVHDVFPENLLPAKIVSRRSPIYPVLKYIFDRAYSRADSLIAIGRDMQDLLLRKTGNRSRIEYVPNWADLEDVSVGQSSASDYFLTRNPNRVVFQFFGNIGRVQGIEFLLEAISKIKSKNASFLFIGGGAAESELKSFISRNPSLDVVHVPSLPFNRNNEGLSACDVAIIPLAPGMLGLGVPSKAYFSLAANKPILVVGDVGAELQLLVKENPEIGWFCQSGNADVLALLIDDISKIDLSAVAQKPRAMIAAKCSYSAAIERYALVLSNQAGHARISSTEV